MKTTMDKLREQLDQRLQGVSDYESIEINARLSELLDSYDIPENARLACLTIDTSMRHLDNITSKNLSKHSILIGDLLSAHFYTLLAQINDAQYQLDISEAIVEVNELKSSLHQQVLSQDEISNAIMKVETLFPYITLKHFGMMVDEITIYQYLFKDKTDYYPSYFKTYDQERVKQYFNDIKQ